MKRQWAGGAVLACALVSGPAWASSGPKVTDAEVAQVELAIRSAENAAAADYAGGLMDRARGALSAAQNERAKKHSDRARALLEEASAAAAAAESKATAMRLEEQRAAVKKQNEDLEIRIRGFNDQAQRQ